MPKINDEIPDYEEVDGEEDLIETPTPPKKGRPKTTTKVQPTKVIPKRYIAFLQQQREGIMDSETREVVAETWAEGIADLKNDLDELKQLVGSLTE